MFTVERDQVFTEEQRSQALVDERDLIEMNRLLDEAGRIADRLTQRGYVVTMNLWHDTQGSVITKGRLQWNVAKAYLREGKQP